jgi:hypothetical protein
MVLSLRPLSGFASINTFTFNDAFFFSQGDTPTLYFQLVDTSVNSAYAGYNPTGLAYHPPPTAILSITITSINQALSITRYATLVSANDTSIWSMALMPSDTLAGNMSVKMVLMDGSTVINGYAGNVIRVSSVNPGC